MNHKWTAYFVGFLLGCIVVMAIAVNRMPKKPRPVADEHALGVPGVVLEFHRRKQPVVGPFVSAQMVVPPKTPDGMTVRTLVATGLRGGGPLWVEETIDPNNVVVSARYACADRLLVRLKDRTQSAAFAEALKDTGWKLGRAPLPGWIEVTVNTRTLATVPQAIERVGATGLVAEAKPRMLTPPPAPVQTVED